MIAELRGRQTQLPVCIDSMIKYSTTDNIWTRGLFRWINDEHIRVYGDQLECVSPQQQNHLETPQQIGLTDCGIFVLAAAEFAIKGFKISEFDYSQQSMQFIRTKIAINLLNTSIGDQYVVTNDNDNLNFINLLSSSSDSSVSDQDSNDSSSDDEIQETCTSINV